MEDYKELFVQCALLIPDHENLSTMKVCELYLNSDDEILKNAYISILVLRYWKKINTYYYKSLSLRIDKEIVLGWLFDSVIGALKAHSWTRPESSLYNDKAAFDKVMNRCLACARYTDYQASNRMKRKSDHERCSLDQLKEDYNDAYIGYDKGSVEEYKNIEMNDLVTSFFNKKDYFKAFFIDGVLHHEVCVCGNYSDARMKTHLLHLNRTVNEFAARYKLDIDKVRQAATYIIKLGYGKINYKLTYHKEELRRLLS